jgi:beta-lactamase regulating signal transducer with metallopeptidase domain
VIAAWMLFSIVTGCALTAAAAAADRLTSLARRPQRFVWLTALVATSCWPAIALIRPVIAHWREAQTPGLSLPEGAVQRLSSFAISTRVSDIDPRWNIALVVAWALLSSALLVRLATAFWYIRRRRSTWLTTEIDGVGIHLAPDAGPAVVGLHPMHVVLPEWALKMERPLRALVLRHEEEHRAARDPYLLLVTTLVTALIPWNLALWFQARRLRLAIEVDCDARVLRAYPQHRLYALLLLSIAERRTGGGYRLAPALSESTSNLERRITAMSTNATLSRSNAVSLSLVAAIALAIACAVDKPASPDGLNRTQSFVEQGTPVVTQARSLEQRPGGSVDPAMVGARTHFPGSSANPTYFEFQIDKPATLRQSLDMKYPAASKGAGPGNSVFAEFVVDATGRVDTLTFKPLQSSNPAFTAAVKAALSTARFDPAVIQGKNVKQLVEMGFVTANLRDLRRKKP